MEQHDGNSAREEKQDLWRRGDIGYMGSLLNVLGIFLVLLLLFLQTALVDFTFVKAD